jgi:hypothetical protein
MPVFTRDEDFIAFKRGLEESVARTGTRFFLVVSWEFRFSNK